MGNATSVQTQFSGGEISPYAQGRFDLPTYKASLNVCKDAFPSETQAWTRRPGAAYAGPTIGGAQAVVRNFDFAEATPYTMEFVAGFLSFRQGTRRVTTNDDLIILSISAASPAVVQTSAPHGWSTNDTVMFANLGVLTPLLQSRNFKINVVDATRFSIRDAVTGAPIDGSALGSFVSGAPTVQRLLIVATPYLAADLQNIRVVQTETALTSTPSLLTQVAYVFCAGYKPYVLVMNAKPTSTAFATFTWSVTGNSGTYGFVDGPYLEPIPGISALLLTISGPTITLASTGGAPFANCAPGQWIRIFVAPKPWGAGTTFNGGDPCTYYTNVEADPSQATYWYCVSGPVSSSVPPPADPTHWIVADQSTTQAQWVWGTVASVGGGGTSITLGGLSNSLANASYTVYLFRLGAFGDKNNAWPTCGSYHEGRLWMGGALDNRMDASQPNLLLPAIMSPTEIDGTVTDASGLSYILNAPAANPVFWIQPDQQGLIVGTQAGEWLFQATAANAPLTATNVQAHQATRIGCSNIEPRRTELTNVFVQKHQRRLMEYFADVFSGKLTAPDLSELAKHLTVSNIEEIAYQQSLTPIIWARCGDGSLIGATYRRDSLFSSQPPKFLGWHRHTIEGGNSVVSICTGPSVDGNLDALTMVVLDAADGTYHVNVLTDNFEENSTLLEAAFVDRAITPSPLGFLPASADNPNGAIQFNGLWGLNGKTVLVWAAGLDCGDFLVANGAVTVPFGDGIYPGQGAGGGLFTQAWWTANPVAVCGIDYASQGQLLPPVDPREAGTQAGAAFAKVQRTQQFGAKLANSGPLGIKFGGSFSTMRLAQFKTPGGAAGILPTQMFSGLHWNALDDAYSLGTAPCWQANRGSPMTLTALGSFLHTQDR